MKKGKLLVSLLLVITYLLFMFVIDFSYYHTNMTVKQVCLFALLSILFGVITILIFSEIRRRIKLKNKPPVLSSKTVFIVVLFLSFLITFLWFNGFYPGLLNPDNYDQYRMAIGEISLYDWHPIIHTELFFALPAFFIKNYSFITFINLTCFSLSFAYLASSLTKGKYSKILIILMVVYVFLNPYLFITYLYPNKDIPVCFMVMIIFAYYINIVSSKGDWLDSKWHNFLLIFFSLLIILVRRNAILFVGPLLLIIYFIYNRKIVNKIIGGSILVVLLVIYKIFMSSLNYEAGYPAKAELFIPGVRVWAYNFVKHNSMQEEMLKINDINNYDILKQPGDHFSDFKYTAEYNENYINNISFFKYIKYTLYNVYKYPLDSLKTISYTFNMVFSIDNDVKIQYDLYDPIEATINNNRHEHLNKILTKYSLFICDNRILRIIFSSYGLIDLIILLIVLYKYCFNEISAIHGIPLLVFNYLTMLVLGERDYRNLLFSLVLVIPTIALLVKKEDEHE